MKYLVLLIVTLLFLLVPFLDDNKSEDVINEFNNGTALECRECAVFCSASIISNKTWDYSDNLKKFYNDKGNYFELSDCIDR